MCMKRTSAGLLMYRWHCDNLEVLLCHPGGPLYEGRDDGVWSIPKGGVETGESILQGAFREFTEETGMTPHNPSLISLGTAMEYERRIMYAWAFQGTCDTTGPVRSNLFEMEWPPRSGCIQTFPEVDRLSFFTPEAARQKIEAPQRRFLDELQRCVYPALLRKAL